MLLVYVGLAHARPNKLTYKKDTIANLSKKPGNSLGGPATFFIIPMLVGALSWDRFYERRVVPMVS